jgi:FK506-binding nuclear protein
VENSFHISMAALEPAVDKVGGADRFVSLMIQHEKAEFLLCTLEHGKLHQQPMDLNFTEGEEVTFFLNGKGVVHLTGYLAPEDEGGMEDTMDDTLGYDSEEEEESEAEEEDSNEDEDEDIPKLTQIGYDEDSSPGKRKRNQKTKAIKKLKMEEQDDDDEEDDDEDFILHEAVEDEEEDDSMEESEDEDEEDEDEDEDELGESFLQNKKQKSKDVKKETPKQPKSKVELKSKESPNSKKADKEPATPNGTETKKKKKKKNKNKNQNIEDETESKKVNPDKPEQKQTPKSAMKKVLSGHVIMEEVKEGHGPTAKAGKMVHVYYTGRLQNGKVFDSCTGGKPLKFKLGASEVIKGWDIGLQGMKVGGKRKLKIPPKMGYGNSRQGPIPPNSTLDFDVELKAVS